MVTTSRQHEPTPGLRGNELAASLHTALRRYVRLLGAEPGTADDLVQEAFVIALRRPGFDADVPGAAFAFLRTTVRHLWLRRHRGRLTERELADADAVWDRRCGDGGDAYVLALRTCVRRLPERSQRLLQAIHGAGASRTEAAALLGLGKHGVKSALQRLRALLRDCIERRLRQEEP